jgi:hypothetical protein
MAANLAATKDLPLAEHVTSLLAGVLGGVQAHDLVAEAGRRAVSAGLPLRDVLLAVPKLEGRWPRRASRRSRSSRPSSRSATSAPPTPSSPPPWPPTRRSTPSYRKRVDHG